MGNMIERILGALQKQAELTVRLLDMALTPDLKTFYKKAYRVSSYGPKRFKTDWAEWYKKRQSFYSLLNQLKRDGLIVKTGRRGSAQWHITPRGLVKLRQRALKRERHPAGIPMRAYTTEQSSGVVIVAFDIPEKMRKKREWLRENLIALKLKLLQKSVWIGTTRIPQDFIKDLHAQDILRFVHIFSVGKRGTITEMSDYR